MRAESAGSSSGGGFPHRYVYVVSWNRHDGRCKYCRQSIVWATTARGKMLPLNPGAFILEVKRDPETRVRYDVLEADASHIVTCANRPPRRGKSARKRGDGNESH